jgi:hypothetical protein
MRPVDLGSHPTVGGVPVIFRKYQDATPYLKKRIGEYCSYCEKYLSSAGSLAVEHKQPKDIKKYRHLEKVWANFLLSCFTCNSTKGKRDYDLDRHVWPDTEYTFLAITYPRYATPTPSAALTAGQQQIAQATLTMVGLQAAPGATRRRRKKGIELEPRDWRWRDRDAAWKIAEFTRDNFNGRPDDMGRDLVVTLAKHIGFWSVWMTIFAFDAGICGRLVQAFPGTAADCFDVAGNPVPRPGGKV